MSLARQLRTLAARLLLSCAIPAGLTVPVVDRVTPSPAAVAAATGEATCASPDLAEDLLETALQGQVPRTDQESGRSQQGYCQGVRLVSSNDIGRRGNNIQMTWLDDCAYVSTTLAPDTHELAGTAVLDVSDRLRPKLVDILHSPTAGWNSHEALEANDTRRVLAATSGGQMRGLFARWLDIYDASDCRHPKLRGRYDYGTPELHGLRIARDGKTVYVSSQVGEHIVTALDISNLRKPRVLARWSPQSRHYTVHDLDLSADGTRAYVGATGPQTGLTILDTSEIQARRPNPRFKMLGETFWTHHGQIVGHTVFRARIAGRPYVLLGGEVPAVGACPWDDGVRLIDVSDEAHPVVVSRFALEVNEPRNCPSTWQDRANYSSHYMGVDDMDDATTMFVTWYSAGLRVVDISNPAYPQEVAYFKPPPQPDTVIPRSNGGDFVGMRNPFFDLTTSDVRYRPNGDIWFTSTANGFQIARLTQPLASRSPVECSMAQCRRLSTRARASLW
jgi:LVIVD repeat-containing protein